MRTTASEVSTVASNSGVIPGMVVDTDRPCPKCGFNVRGIPLGKPCPECGRPIYFGIQAKETHPLADAPYWYLRLTQAALWGLFISLFGAGLVWVARPFVPSSWPLWIVTLALGSAAAVWVASIGALSLPRPPERADRAPMPQLAFWKRAAAVGSQSLWIVAAVAAGIAPGAAWATDLIFMAVVGAMIGVLPTVLMMADVAEFAGDPDRGRRMIVITMVWTVLVVMAAMGLNLRVNLPLPILSALQQGVALMPYFLFAAAMLMLWHFFQLAVVGNWAIEVARREDERVERLRERFHSERMQGALALDNEPFGGPVQAPVGSMMGIRPSKRG